MITCPVLGSGILSTKRISRQMLVAFQGACSGGLMTRFLGRFIRDQSGATTAEYAMLLAIIGSGIAVAALTLSAAVSTALTDAGDCVASNATC